MIRQSDARKSSIVITTAAAALLVLFAGCATTVQSQPQAAKAIEEREALPAAVRGFLGPDASKLGPGPEGGAALVWFNPEAQWNTYDKVLLEPVQFWAAKDSKVSTSDQQTLTTYFYNALRTNLQSSFNMVEQPGAGVMRLQVALMDATTATPGLRSVSVVVPQARILNAAQSLVTGGYAFVGSAEAAMKASDSVSNVLLGEAVDQRAGGMGIKGAASFRWGDAQNVIDYWAARIPQRLQELKTQSPSKP